MDQLPCTQCGYSIDSARYCKPSQNKHFSIFECPKCYAKYNHCQYCSVQRICTSKKTYFRSINDHVRRQHPKMISCTPLTVTVKMTPSQPMMQPMPLMKGSRQILIICAVTKNQTPTTTMDCQMMGCRQRQII